MEVVLLEAAGLPDGCLLSMRGGSARRAAAVSCRQQATLRLPRGLPPDGQVSLDFLAPVGSAVLQLQPGVEQCPVEWSLQGLAASPATVKFQVREDLKVASLAGSPPCSARGEATPKAGPGLGAKRHLGVLEEQGYLEKHGLLTWVQELLQSLLRDRPDDPWGYIGERSSAHTQRICTGLAESQDASTSASARAAGAAGAPPEAHEKKERSLGISDARQRLRSALGDAAREGRLVRLLSGESRPEAAGDGLTKGQNATSSSSTTVPPHGCSAQEQATDLAALRARLRGVLVGGAADGRLQEAVQSQEEDDRLRLRNVLSAAVSSGRLQEVLQANGSKSSLPHIPAKDDRVQLRNVLSAAASSGRLQEVLQANRRESCQPEIPAKAGMMRLPPQSTWELAYATPPAPHDDGVQDVRRRLRGVLAGAARSGNLSSTLGSLEAGRSPSQPSSPRPEAPKMRLPPASTWQLAYASPAGSRWRPTLPYANADLRSHLRNTFSRATRDGRLERILEEGPEVEDEDEDEEAEEEEEQQQQEEAETESPRARARDVLSKAVIEGELDVNVPPEDPRERIRTLLSHSAVNGRLQKAMEEAQSNGRHANQHLATAKAQLRGLLSTAVADGRLQSLLPMEQGTQCSPPNEELRQEAAGLLSRAAKSGLLLEVLATRRKELQLPAASMGVDLRDAASLLSGAATSGRLLEVLAAQRQQARAEAVVNARASARDILMDAAAGEQLENALRQVRQEAGREENMHQHAPAQETERLSQLRSVLVRSAVDGHLADALAAEPTEVPSPSNTAAKPAELRSLCARVRGLLVGAAQKGQLAGVLSQELPAKPQLAASAVPEQAVGRRAWHLLPSSGSWLAAAPRSLPNSVPSRAAPSLDQPAKVAAQPAVWHHLPSAGTWLARAPVTPFSGLEAAPAQHCETLAAPVSVRKDAEVAWHLRPSTGTWLAPAPRRAPSVCPAEVTAAPAATANQTEHVSRHTASLAARMPGLRELVEEQFEGACENLWSIKAVPDALRGFTPEAELVFEEDGLCLPSQDGPVPHLPDLASVATAAATDEGGAGPPSPTHSESSSVALLRELLHEEGATAPAEADERADPSPAPAPARAQLAVDPPKMPEPQPQEPQPSPPPAKLTVQPADNRGGEAEAALKAAPAEAPKGLERRARRPEGSSKSSTALLGASRPAGSPSIRRPSPGSHNPPRMDKATWGTDLQKGSWKDPVLRGRLGDTGERLLAARAAGLTQEATGSVSRQQQPEQDEVRPNTAVRRQEAAREVLKDIAGLGDGAGATAETVRTVTEHLLVQEAPTAAALADLGTAGPSKFAGHPREAREDTSKGGRPSSGLMAGLKRLTSRSGTAQSSLAPLSKHHSGSGGSSRVGEESLPEQALAPRFPRERDPLWVESGPTRLRREHAEASVSCSEDEKLRTNLGKLLSFRRKDQFSV